MKKLSILRHAKAETPTFSHTDFERNLSERGREDAARIAKVFKRLDSPLEWVLSSPAIRAKQTTEIIVPLLDAKPFVNWQGKIYEASLDTLLHLLAQIPAGIEHALLVGHNPGLEEVVAGLCSNNSAYPHIQLTTATFAHLELDIFSWDQIRLGCGSLHLLVTPG